VSHTCHLLAHLMIVFEGRRRLGPSVSLIFRLPPPPVAGKEEVACHRCGSLALLASNTSSISGVTAALMAGSAAGLLEPTPTPGHACPLWRRQARPAWAHGRGLAGRGGRWPPSPSRFIAAHACLIAPPSPAPYQPRRSVSPRLTQGRPQPTGNVSSLLARGSSLAISADVPAAMFRCGDSGV